MKMEQQVIQWYEANKRDFPWRYTQNPYYIWICEIMSQQTQMVRVVEYYQRFIAMFPTLETLADAEEEQLLKAWEGLGYYSRVRNMQIAARTIVDELGGVFPNNYEALLTLKGIGTYTAASIASIAFDEPVAAVDGNVLRVYSRLVEMEDDILQQKTKNKVKVALEKELTALNPSSFNQGMIELGALICTPTSPKCQQCPLIDRCIAHQLGTIAKYPVKKKKTKQKEEELYTFIIYNKNQDIYMKKEGEKQFLHGLYALPQYTNNDNIAEVFAELAVDLQLKLDSDSLEYKGKYQHIFSHKIWNMSVYVCRANTNEVADFVKIAEAPIANAHRKLL